MHQKTFTKKWKNFIFWHNIFIPSWSVFIASYVAAPNNHRIIVTWSILEASNRISLLLLFFPNTQFYLYFSSKFRSQNIESDLKFFQDIFVKHAAFLKEKPYFPCGYCQNLQPGKRKISKEWKRLYTILRFIYFWNKRG